MEFDGLLKEEEIDLLIDCGFKNKDIEFIKNFVYEYKDHLTGFVDLIGDKKVPTKQLLFNLKHMGYLLKDDPKDVLSPKDVLIRKKIIYKLIKKFGPLFLTTKQIFENRSDYVSSYENKKITLPKESVIYTPNHHFKDDVFASYLATLRQTYILFGSMPQFYNSIDGIGAHLAGSLMTNRKVSSSKKASIQKALYAMDLGADILCFPEGVWDKYPHKILINFWPGTYLIAKERDAKIVPVINYIYDPTMKIERKINPIHTIIDDPISLSGMSQKAFYEYLNEVMSTWYYLMQEKYGQITREKLMKFYEARAKMYNKDLNFDEKGITFNEAYEVYLLDLLQTVDYYDFSIETSYEYKNKDIINPEDVYQNIVNLDNLNNTGEILEAKKIMRIRKMENYQRRF